MKRRRRLLNFTGIIILFVLIATVIQIAVLTYDYIISKTEDKLLIALLILIVVIILSAICAAIDALRRKYTVDKPVQKILQATEEIAKGNFDVKIDITHPYERYNEYDYIMENVNIMSAELSKSEVLKTDFISNVSHELKTPLAVIKNYSALLDDENLDSESIKKYLKAINNASDRLSDLITNILKLNKLENQEIKAEKRKFDLSEALAEVVIRHEELIEQKNISLGCDIDEIKIISSPDLLEIVWNNLLSNAIKFTPEGGSINVSLKRENKNAVVKVKDSGIGISKEVGQRIFEKFYQADSSRAVQGNGLGLALVKKVIDILGGEILVDSELNKGSEFTIVLNGVIYEQNS